MIYINAIRTAFFIQQHQMEAMIVLKQIKRFFKNETTFCIAAICAIATMFFVPPDFAYISYIDLRVLCLLLCLMTVVAGFKDIGVFQWLICVLLRHIRNGRILSITLMLLPFFCSMLITNDVALLILIPFTLSLLDQLGVSRAAIPILVLQTIAANLGSIATPIGNPQNLYLYAAYSLHASAFFSVTLPLTTVSLIGLTIAATLLLPRTLPQHAATAQPIGNIKHLVINIVLFLLCLLTVFRVIPYPITTSITILILAITDRSLFKQIDFMLLATFVCFFLVSGNLGRIKLIRNCLQTLLNRNALLTAVGASQIISNVPAAVLLRGFTDQWRALLAGVNIGGLGTPIASLASLITLKFYLRRPDADTLKFLSFFMIANLIGLGILLVFAMLI